MLPVQIAITSLTDQVGLTELSQVAAVLQRQVTRDFTPLWGIEAAIDAFPFDQIPPGAWPVIVQDVIEAPGAAGIHRTEADDTPYALLQYGETWSLAASHECLEMLADPSGCRKIAGDSPVAAHGRVEFLLEVCAPCSDAANAYAINGVLVSDFCTPHYYGASPGAGGRCSFTGALRQPLALRPEGALSWFAGDGLLYQARADRAGVISVHGGFSVANRDGQLLREFVNGLTPDQPYSLSNAEWPPALLQAEAALCSARGRHAARFRDDIAWRFGFATAGLPKRWVTEGAPMAHAG
jgi:hypothetical protein